MRNLLLRWGKVSTKCILNKTSAVIIKDNVGIIFLAATSFNPRGSRSGV
jgi:hypothetical protein